MQNRGVRILLVALCCAIPAAGLETPRILSSNSFVVPLTAPGFETRIPKGISSSSRPKIVSREDWRAREPVGKMILHKPSRITIHHTASRQKEKTSIEQKMRDLQAFSQTASTLSTGKLKPAWPDVPYHFYIAADGRIAEGRKIDYVGDTNTEYDPTGHILVVLEGNFEIEQPAGKQLQSLRELVSWLAHEWNVRAGDIKGHRDYARTACPGKNLAPEVRKLREALGK